MLIIPKKFQLDNKNYTRVGRNVSSIHNWFYQDEKQNWFSVKFNEEVESTSREQDPTLLHLLTSDKSQFPYPHGVEKKVCPKPENIKYYANDINIKIENNKVIESNKPKKVNSEPNLRENKFSAPKFGSVQDIQKIAKVKAEDLDFTKADDWRFFVPLKNDKQNVDLTDEKIQAQLQKNVYRKLILRDQANAKDAKYDDSGTSITKLFTTTELTTFSKIYTKALVHYNAIVTDKNGKNDKPKQALASMFEKNKGSFRQIIQLAPELLWPVDKLFRASVPESIHNLIAKTNTNYQKAKKQLSNEPEQNTALKDLVKNLDDFFNSENFFSKAPKAPKAPKTTIGSLHLILKDNAAVLGQLVGNSKAIVDIAKSVVVECFKDEYKKDCKKSFTFFKSDTYKKVHEAAADKLKFEDIDADDGKRKRTARVLESFKPNASK